MAADLSTSGDVQPVPDLTITEVGNANSMREYRDVLASGFGEGPAEADWVTAVFAAIGYAAGWHHYVGHAAETPVATASLLLTLPVGGIYFVCTHPDHRRECPDRC